MIPSIGWQELAIIFFIVLIIFGPKSLPKIGHALGKGIKDFKDGINGMSHAIEEEDKPAQVNPPAPRATLPSSSEESHQDSEIPKVSS